MRFVGIDVSKDTLHVGVLEPLARRSFPNSVRGRRQAVEWLKRNDQVQLRVVVEATASYSEGIALALAGTEGAEVMVANPRATKNFAKALEQRGKTDRLDSMMLARFAASMPFRAWTPPSAVARQLRSLVRRRLQLVRQLAKEKVRIKEARTADSLDPYVLEDLDDHVRHLAMRIKKLEQRALDAVRTDPELDAWRIQLCSVPGIADVTALTILGELACLPADMTARQLVAYTGLDPQPHQSGTMDAKRRISKRGNKRLRTALYLAAWNTTRCSPEVRAWRERLILAGKNPKLADIAVARRLIHAIHGMRRTGTSWDGPKFHRAA